MHLPFSFAHKSHNAESVLLSFAQHGSEPEHHKTKDGDTHVHFGELLSYSNFFLLALPTDHLDLDLSITGSHDEIIEPETRTFTNQLNLLLGLELGGHGKKVVIRRRTGEGASLGSRPCVPLVEARSEDQSGKESLGDVT